MKYARRYYSWNGSTTNLVSASDVKSYWNASSIGPFVSENGRPVCWVGWGKREDGRKIPPYFRHWPQTGLNFEEAKRRREKACAESPIHRKTKPVCAEALIDLIDREESLWWGGPTKIRKYRIIFFAAIY